MANKISDNDVTISPELRLDTDIPPISAFPNTKDISYHPLFKGDISKLVWRLTTVTITRPGIWFLIATILIMMASGVTLDVQAYVLFIFAFAIWFTAVIFLFIYKPKVSLKVNHSDRVCVGQILPVDITVKQNNKRNTPDLKVVPYNLPPDVDAFPGDGVDLLTLKQNESKSARLGLYCKKRGMYRLKGYRVETDFPFGLLRTYQQHPIKNSLLVYPWFQPLVRLSIPTGRRYHPGGVALASNLGESFEFLGNREYQEGDNIRDIDWRATARLGEPIIREYREEYFLRVGVVLDTHVIKNAPQIRKDDFERAVSIAASVSDYMSRQDYIVDIFAAGPNLYHLTAGRSLAYLDQILDILACVDVCREEPFETLEPEILENMSKITTIICVFLDWNEARQIFVQKLAQAGAGIKVIIARDTDCTLDPAGASDLIGNVHIIGSRDFATGVEEL